MVNERERSLTYVYSKVKVQHGKERKTREYKFASSSTGL